MDDLTAHNALRTKYFPAWRSLTADRDADAAALASPGDDDEAEEEGPPVVHVSRHGSVTISRADLPSAAAAAAASRPSGDPLSPSVSELYPGRRAARAAARSPLPDDFGRMHIGELLDDANLGIAAPPGMEDRGDLDRALFAEAGELEATLLTPHEIANRARVNEIMRRALAADDMFGDELPGDREAAADVAERDAATAAAAASGAAEGADADANTHVGVDGDASAHADVDAAEESGAQQVGGEILRLSEYSLLQSELRRTGAKHDRLEELLLQHSASAAAGHSSTSALSASNGGSGGNSSEGGIRGGSRLSFEERRPDLFRLAGLTTAMPPPPPRRPMPAQAQAPVQAAVGAREGERTAHAAQSRAAAVHITRHGSVYVDGMRRAEGGGGGSSGFHVTRNGSVFARNDAPDGAAASTEEPRPRTQRAKLKPRVRPRPRTPPSSRARSPDASAHAVGGTNAHAAAGEQRTVRKMRPSRLDTSPGSAMEDTVLLANSLPTVRNADAVLRPDGLFTPPNATIQTPQLRARARADSTDGLSPLWVRPEVPQRHRSSPRTLAVRAEARRVARERGRRHGSAAVQSYVDRLGSGGALAASASSYGNAETSTAATEAKPTAAATERTEEEEVPPSLWKADSAWKPDTARAATRGRSRARHGSNTAVVRHVGADVAVVRLKEEGEAQARKVRARSKEAAFEIHLTESQQVYWDTAERERASNAAEAEQREEAEAAAAQHRRSVEARERERARAQAAAAVDEDEQQQEEEEQQEEQPQTLEQNETRASELPPASAPVDDVAGSATPAAPPAPRFAETALSARGEIVVPAAADEEAVARISPPLHAEVASSSVNASAPASAPADAPADALADSPANATTKASARDGDAHALSRTMGYVENPSARGERADAHAGLAASMSAIARPLGIKNARWEIPVDELKSDECVLFCSVGLLCAHVNVHVSTRSRLPPWP